MTFVFKKLKIKEKTETIRLGHWTKLKNKNRKSRKSRKYTSELCRKKNNKYYFPMKASLWRMSNLQFIYGS